MDFQGKNYIVVGASSGIGLAVSQKLAKNGANVVLMARRSAELQKALNMLSPGNHRAILFDAGVIGDINDVVTKIYDDCATIAGLVYCVGNGDIAKLRDNAFDRLHAIMLTNFYGFMEFVRILMMKKPKKEPCSIVAISSLASTVPEKYFTSYSASKAALEAAIRCLALELAAKNTTIKAIKPAVVKTPRLDYLNEITGDIETKIKQNNFQPLGLIPPEDVAELAIFLLGDFARYIDGVSIPINGGAAC